MKGSSMTGGTSRVTAISSPAAATPGGSATRASRSQQQHGDLVLDPSLGGPEIDSPPTLGGMSRRRANSYDEEEDEDGEYERGC